MKCQKNKFDLKIGNYIRTTSGKIRKIISLYDTGDVFVETHSCIKQENIISSSNNIIDLIEIGDFIEYKQSNMYWNIPTRVTGRYNRQQELTELMVGEIPLKNVEITSIVTRELFEKMSYVIGDKNE